MALSTEFAFKVESFKTGLSGPFVILDSATRALRITHDATMKSLKTAGFDAYPMSRTESETIKCAIVYGVSEARASELIQMSQTMGNESCIYGTGKEIRKVFHCGKRKGRYSLASVPHFHRMRPVMDCYSLPYNSAHFSLDFSSELFPMEKK
jgi:hypothetical protein